MTCRTGMAVLTAYDSGRGGNGAPGLNELKVRKLEHSCLIVKMKACKNTYHRVMSSRLYWLVVPHSRLFMNGKFDAYLL